MTAIFTKFSRALCVVLFIAVSIAIDSPVSAVGGGIGGVAPFSLYAQQPTNPSSAYPFEKPCAKELHQKLKDVERSHISGLVVPKKIQQETAKIYADLTNCKERTAGKTEAEEDYYLNFYYLYLDVYGKISDTLFFQGAKPELAMDAYKELVALFQKDKKKIKKMQPQFASEIFALYGAILFDIMPLLSGLNRFSNSSEIYSNFFEGLRLSKNNHRLYLTKAQIEVVIPPASFSIYKAKKILKKLEKENLSDVETFHTHTIFAALWIRMLDFEKAQYHLQQAEKIFPGNPSLFFAKQNAREMTFFPQ